MTPHAFIAMPFGIKAGAAYTGCADRSAAGPGGVRGEVKNL